MKYALLASILFFFLSVSAQDCNPESLAGKPGKWRGGIQGSIHDVTAADQPREKSVLAAIEKMMKSNYTPTGCVADYSHVFLAYPTAGQTRVGDPYEFSAYILAYECDRVSADKSKYYITPSTFETFVIAANRIGGFNTLLAANIPADDFRGYLKMPRKPQKRDGYYFLGEAVVANSQEEKKVIEYSWLITYNDTLPFSYVSRKEYLMLQMKRLQQSLKDNPGEKDYTNKFIKNVNEYLKQPESALSQPAICMWNEEERFENFVDEGTPVLFLL